MGFSDINRHGLVLIGCGRMGGAMLTGWLAKGIVPEAVTVIDPHPAPELKETNIRLNQSLPEMPAVIVLAVKPQVMEDILPKLNVGPETMVLSVAAGVTLSAYQKAFPVAPVVRAMPNTPAAIGRGITAIVGNHAADSGALDLAEKLLSVVGDVVRLRDETHMDAVTAVSGSGPAYVFYMIEALAAAGKSHGLSDALSLQLARATVAGAGALAVADNTSPAALREAVTSPGGTTAAGLAVLMDPDTGLRRLIMDTVSAAAKRSQELGE